MTASERVPITCAHDGTYHDWDPDDGPCPDPREFNTDRTGADTAAHLADRHIARAQAAGFRDVAARIVAGPK